MSGVDEMQDSLALATREQAVSLLERLGVDNQAAEEASMELPRASNASLTAVPGPRVDVAPQHEQALLFLPQTTQGMAAFYLLTRLPGADEHRAWRCTDSAFLGSFTHTVTFEFVRVHGMAGPLLVFHHVNLGHGSNYTEDQTEVYAVRQGKLVELMHTTDYLSKAVWENGQEAQTLEQESTLLPMPDGSLEETRASKLDEVMSAVERRSWRWDLAARHFTAGPFRHVLAR